MKVDFIFKLDEKVETPFGTFGFVEMLGFDDGGKKYYVKTDKTGSWFKEIQLKKDDHSG